MTPWVRNIFGMTLEATRQGMTYLEKKAKPKLIDVAEGTFLAEKARKMNVAMRKLLHNYSVEKERVSIKKKVRKKVKEALTDTFGNEDMVEEVTERLADVSVYDPFYKKWFA